MAQGFRSVTVCLAHCGELAWAGGLPPVARPYGEPVSGPGRGRQAAALALAATLLILAAVAVAGSRGRSAADWMRGQWAIATGSSDAAAGSSTRQAPSRGPATHVVPPVMDPAIGADVIDPATTPAGAWLWGYNVSGPEWGENNEVADAGQWGSIHQSTALWDAMKRDGATLIRMPIGWAQIQPVPRGPLRDSEVALVRADLDRAAARGLKVVLDVHNGGGRMVGWDKHRFGDGTIGMAELNDLWRRLAQTFGWHPAIHAWGLLNEPTDFVTPEAPGDYYAQARKWERLSQAAVDTIRATGDRHLISVSTYEYANPSYVTRLHPRGPWIRDPLGGSDRLWYEVHVYVEQAGNDEAPIPDRVAETFAGVQSAQAWAKAGGVQLYIGETGAAAKHGWNGLLGQLMVWARANAIPTTVWAAGLAPEDLAIYTQDARTRNDAVADQLTAAASGEMTADRLRRAVDVLSSGDPSR